MLLGRVQVHVQVEEGAENYMVGYLESGSFLILASFELLYGANTLLYCLYISMIDFCHFERTSRSMHLSVSILHSIALLSVRFFSSPSVCVPSPLEHGNWVRGVRGPRLRHVPMLDNACPIHPVNVCQRNWLLVHLIDTHVDEADVVVEALAEDYVGHKRDNCKRTRSQPFRATRISSCVRRGSDAESLLTVRQFLLVRDPALSVKGIVLGQIESDVLVESANDVFFDVELVDESVEDLALDVFRRGVPGAVAGVRADVGVGAGVKTWYSDSEEGGEGSKGCEDGGGPHLGCVGGGWWFWSGMDGSGVVGFGGWA